MTDINVEIKEAVDGFKAKQAELDSFITDAKTQLAANGTEAKEAAKKADELLSKFTDQADRLHDIEQKLAEGVKNGKEAPKTLGGLLIASEGYKNFVSGNAGKARVEFKNTIVGSDALVAPQRLPGIIPGAFRDLRIRDVIPAGATSSNSIEYTRELAFTNAAAETAEAGAKPESDLTFELATTPVRTIAHWLKLSKQVMDDAPALQSYVDTRLRYGVDLRIDNQLLKGDGTGSNLSGMLNTGNYTAFTATAGDTALDSLNKAIYQVWAADYAPTAMVLSPTDWGAIERLKDTNENYVVGDPVSGTLGRNLWGIPVVISNTMTAGQFILGAMNIAYQVWNREGVVVEMSESDDTNFTSNLVTVRAESRLALASYRPASVVGGALTA